MTTAEQETAIHSQRVTELALRIAEVFESAALRAIRAGGPVHDIGKLALDPEILRKPSAPEPDELAAVRRHPELGAQMLAGDERAKDGINCVLHHHERWDGAGYP